MKYLILALSTLGLFATSPALAKDEAAPAESAPEAQEQAQEKATPPVPDETYDERIKLAKEMHKLRPVRAQVEGAINQYALSRPQAERETFKTAMRNVFNIKALEKISTDAYAETFTVEELRAMVEYYRKPEAISASAKFGDYANIVYPEIVRMLDRAAIRVKTGQ